MLSTAACSHVFYENTKKDWISHCYEGEENSQGERIRLFEEQGINLQSHVLSIWAGECMDLRSGSTFALSFEFEDTEPELIRRFLAMFKEGAAQVTYSTETGFRPGTVPGKYRQHPGAEAFPGASGPHSAGGDRGLLDFSAIFSA